MTSKNLPALSFILASLTLLGAHLIYSLQIEAASTPPAYQRLLDSISLEMAAVLRANDNCSQNFKILGEKSARVTLKNAHFTHLIDYRFERGESYRRYRFGPHQALYGMIFFTGAKLLDNTQSPRRVVAQTPGTYDGLIQLSFSIKGRTHQREVPVKLSYFDHGPYLGSCQLDAEEVL